MNAEGEAGATEDGFASRQVSGQGEVEPCFAPGAHTARAAAGERFPPKGSHDAFPPPPRECHAHDVFAGASPPTGECRLRQSALPLPLPPPPQSFGICSRVVRIGSGDAPVSAANLSPG